ncbi:unnamed protein product [Adineta ricciae]|uniref:Uncharacterized protein n=1 Tax=Adineta ricciae TaxID=249248 RepID=A0A815TNN9_ADIRI|nr:unnamed protein product [Adineta ricciae]CAF1508976.1 unnamed protein product [Adineta ricciae]
MSAADKIIQLLTDKASQKLSNYSPNPAVHEEEVATHLLRILESILTSDSYTHEYETTLDHSTLDSEFDECEADSDSFYQDFDYEEEDTMPKVFENFTLSYVKRALGFYDAINPTTEDNVLNTDQSGLELEIHSGRILSYHGEKTTLSTVRSENATTHSYTVQPMISLSGKVIGPVFLCLKEPDGRMSDNIKSNLFKADNVVVTCSASGKLTTSLVKYWRDNVFITSIANSSRTLLLSDSWLGQGDGKGIYEMIKDCKRMVVPPKTTAKIQPLDAFLITNTKLLIDVFTIESFSMILISKWLNATTSPGSIRLFTIKS